MDEREFVAQLFEEHRTRLRAVAYRRLGSLNEADDAVQEAWLRLNRTDVEKVDSLGGWLTTAVARVSLNMLRSRRSRREDPFDVRMPEPIVDRPDGTDPEHEALLADSVGLALLVVLETGLRAGGRLARAARRRCGRGPGARLRPGRTGHPAGADQWRCRRRRLPRRAAVLDRRGHGPERQDH
jgi:RNA polymerase sigma-70 factor (ECF subfamily)